MEKLLNQMLGYLGKRFEGLEAAFRAYKSEINGAINSIGPATESMMAAADEMAKLSRAIEESNTDQSLLMDSISKADARIMVATRDVTKSSQALTKVADSISSIASTFRQSMDRSGKVIDGLSNHGAEVERILSSIETQSAIIKSLAEKDNGSKDINNAIGEMSKAISELKVSMPDEVSFKEAPEIIAALGRVQNALPKTDFTETNTVLSSILSAIKKFEMPKSFKLNEDQFRELRVLIGNAAGGSGGIVVGGGAPAPVASIIRSSRKVVSVTNTAVALGTDNCETVFITALTTNSDAIVFGDSSVVYTEGSRTGKLMNNGDSITISARSLAMLYINGAAGDGVSFTYTKL